MVIWIIGLSGSGKTTLGKALSKYLLSKKIASVHLDGDDLRSVWGEDIGYSIEDRRKNSKRQQKISKIFEDQGLVVVTSTIALFEDHRIENRKIFKDYFEIFLDIDIEILKQRRELYKNGKNVVGVDIKYNKPITYDLKFEKNYDVNLMVQDVLKAIEQEGLKIG